jgi:hypothetical protein
MGLLATQRCTTRYSIDAPLDLVWSVLTDIEHQAEWYEGVSKTEQTSESPEIWRIYRGADYSEIEIVKRAFPVYEIALLRHMVHVVVPPNPQPYHHDIGVSARDRYTLEASGSGCILTMQSEVTNKLLRVRLYSLLFNTMKRSQKLYYAKLSARVQSLKGAIYLKNS